ncbi:MAG: PKD domain-containing protein [Bacteroidota bacterium]
MKKIYTIILVTAFALASMNVNATMHYITVGASINNTFSPSFDSVAVGDTIDWVSVAGVHSLQSLSIPAGAAPFGCGYPMPQSYYYIVTVPGLYTYNDSLYASMTGSFIAIGNPINLPFYANFTMIPDSAYSLSYWAYTYLSSSNLTFNWDFGDGGTSTLQSPTHTYTATGTYTVCLAYTDGIYSDTNCNSLTVYPAPPSCLALFTIEQDTTAANLNVFILADFSFGSNLTYLWDFGDTTTSTSPYPSHTYLGTGPYQICLTVNNGMGCVQTYCDSLFAVDTSHSLLHPIAVSVVDGPQSPFSVGVGVLPQNSETTIAPNPFTSQTTITFSEEQKNTSIKVMNMLGECIQQLTTSNKQLILDMSGYAKGVYFVKIESSHSLSQPEGETKPVHKKLVLQ